ncbi:MAG: hypothetical protein AAB407_03480 [Patescibacteria group bacterium]
MRIFGTVILLGIAIFAGIHLLRLNTGRLAEERKRNKAQETLSALTEENAKLKENLDYLGNLENLEKDIKALFHYKKPGERLIILVPNNE